MKWNSEHLFELTTLEINTIWRMQYIFWYCLNTTMSQFTNFNVRRVNAVKKRNFYSCTKWVSKVKFTFINPNTVSLFLLHLSFACNSNFHCNMDKKTTKTYIILLHMFCHYSKHTHNNHKICLLASPSCFQQHFNDWFSVLRHNSDLKKLE